MVVSTERLLGAQVDPVERLAVVGSGVINADLRAARLAREAADLANPPEPKVKAKAKPKKKAT